MQAQANQQWPDAVSAAALSKIVPDADGSLTILDHVDLAVAPGSTLAITGPSGSGKSTLLGILAGLDVASSGSVRLFGQELGGMDQDARARLRAERVGFVFQSFQLLPHLTALENVTLALQVAPQRRFGPVQPETLARQLLERVGLGRRLSHTPRTLSGGEQQRVALARAFVIKPGILFADEPTGSLDSSTGQTIIDLMFELNRECGSTLIVVTHDAQVAGRCESRIVLHAGRIVDRVALNGDASVR